VEGDDVGLLASIGRRLGLAAAKAVADAVVTTLEDTTTTMSDSVAFWVSGSNYLASGGGAPSVSTLGAASKALRKLTDGNGNPIGAAPAVLVVPPSLEMSAHVLAASLALSMSLKVAVLSGLTSDAKWFLFPDPQVAPALGLLQLTAAGSPPFTVERGQLRGGEDGTVIETIADFRVSRIARTAYCNIGA
jgi:hypothetical protein